MRVLSLIFTLISLPDAVYAMSCLVMRPGHGLVSEECPPGADGCRMNVRSDHVEWYKWSKLYDRDQLVCIYPREYNGTAGCERKISGDVRCWCRDMNNCNDEKTSRELLSAFQSSDKMKMLAIIRRLKDGERDDAHGVDDIGSVDDNDADADADDNDVYDESAEEEKITTTTTPAPTTTTTTTTTRPTRPSTRKVTHMKHHHILHKTMTSSPKPTTSTASTTTTITTTTKEETIENALELKKIPPTYVTQFGKEFDETRRKLVEEMREEDEILQQMLADEEAEMRRDESESMEEREEQRRKERERNRMERRERARADERRRLTEEETLRKHERTQKHKELLRNDEGNSDRYDYRKSSAALLISSRVSIVTVLLVMSRFWNNIDF